MPRRRSTHKHTSKPGASAPARAASVTPGALGIVFRDDAGPSLLIALISLIAYANAWPDTLVFDDKYFLTAEGFGDLGWSGLARLFLEDLWAGYGADSGLYRPLFAAFMAVEWLLFGHWFAGYHLVNIALHAAVSIGVYRLVHALLGDGPPGPGGRRTAAFLAAAVFAVHPLHTEVVNSVFNGSALWGTLGVVGGLLWLLRHLASRPARAWVGLALIYLLALLTRETAVVLAPLAALLVLLYAAGDWKARLRRTLPVIVLIVPLGVYLALRSVALGQDAGASNASSGLSGVADLTMNLSPEQLFGWNPLLIWAKSWFVALSLWVWPHPLALQHPVRWVPAWLAIGLPLLFGAAALNSLRRKRPALTAGLGFFYIAILPASLLMGRIGADLGFQERFIYLPSVGLSLLLGAGLLWLDRIRGTPWPAMLTLALALAMTPLTWARNADWSDNLRLFRADYALGDPSPRLIGLIVLNQLMAGDVSEATRYCDRHSSQLSGNGKFAESCGQAYGALGRSDDAERALLIAAKARDTRSSSHQLLGKLYARTGRREQAIEHFDRAVETEAVPAMRELRKAQMLYALYRDDPGRRRKALEHVERALALQPRMVQALQLRDRIANDGGQ